MQTGHRSSKPRQPDPSLKIVWTPPFTRDFQALPHEVRARAEKALRLLVENPRHPSLRAKKMQGVEDIWEARVSLSHRITYQLAENTLTLRRIGTHDILKTEARS